MASALLNNADEPIQLACGDWAVARAAYRLFDNDRLEGKKLLQAHQIERISRLEKSSQEIFLTIQDTTVLNYTDHPKKKGLGKITKNAGFENLSMDFFLHNRLLMSESGLRLGLIDQKIYQHTTREKVDHKQRPIIDKESYRWIESLLTTKSLCKGKTVVTVGDRESDVYKMFLEACEIEAKVLIRASRDRILSKNQDQAERFVTLEVRYREVTLKPPKRIPNIKGKILFPVTLQAVWLYEPTPPSDIERLEWMLLTNVSVKTLEDVVKMGKWYKICWQIERYHRILKSGCKIEECRLETYERLKKYVRLKSIIAFRLFCPTLINRIHPEILSDQILEDHEWKALCCDIAKVQKPSQKPPTVKEVIRMVAKIGGFLGRKGDGEPGMAYIWRGWEKLALISEFWLSLHPNLNCG